MEEQLRGTMISQTQLKLVRKITCLVRKRIDIAVTHSCVVQCKLPVTDRN